MFPLNQPNKNDRVESVSLMMDYNNNYVIAIPFTSNVYYINIKSMVERNVKYVIMNLIERKRLPFPIVNGAREIRGMLDVITGENYYRVAISLIVTNVVIR
jgi:hypothetical protein